MSWIYHDELEDLLSPAMDTLAVPSYSPLFQAIPTYTRPSMGTLTIPSSSRISIEQPYTWKHLQITTNIKVVKIDILVSPKLSIQTARVCSSGSM